jgi:hypothetical protein
MSANSEAKLHDKEIAFKYKARMIVGVYALACSRISFSRFEVFAPFAFFAVQNFAMACRASAVCASSFSLTSAVCFAPFFEDIRYPTPKSTNPLCPTDGLCQG